LYFKIYRQKNITILVDWHFAFCGFLIDITVALVLIFYCANPAFVVKSLFVSKVLAIVVDIYRQNS